MAYDEQRKNKSIMKYKSKTFTNGLYNFIKQSNVNAGNIQATEYIFE